MNPIVPLDKENALGILKHLMLPVFLVALLGFHLVSAATTGIVSQLNGIKALLSDIGPILSGVLFIIAGIFYALGQIMPPDKRANFHTAAINIIIGAIVVSVLSFASSSLALASTHLLANLSSG
jgi:hypothetical protein